MEDTIDIQTYIPGVSIMATLVVIILTSMCLHIRGRRRISKPTNIRVSDITSDSVTLQWTKPTHGSAYVTSYKIFARTPDNQDSQWTSNWTSEDDHMTIRGLKPKTNYVFKVRPECGRRHGKESNATEPIETKPDRPGKPKSKPIATSVTHSSIDLSWGEPEYGDDLVTGYTILYCNTQSPTNEWKELMIEGAVCHAVVDGLDSETEYVFKVYSKGESGLSSPESDLSEPILTDKVLSKRMKECSKRLSKDSQCPEVYELPLKQVAGNRYVLGDRPPDSADQKVLMLVGPTGGGKTSLVNFIANYILGIHFEDDFQFELGVGETDSETSMSKTSEVTVYTFHPMKGSRLSYTLTIIDTPGFGSTRGSDVDSATISQLLKFFLNNGLSLLNGVGLVVQASTTPDKKFIFESILSTLGKDLSNNLFLLVTFCDSADENPPAIDTAKEAEMLHNGGHFFKFSNSTFSSRKSSRSSWDMGIASLNAFFEQFEKAKPRSVEITKEVLSKWQNLEEEIKNMQDILASGCEKFEELREAERLLTEQEKVMRENQNFSYEVKRKKHEIVKLPADEKALNCLTCRVTCKYPYESNDSSEHEGGSKYCDVCPRPCPWGEHEVQSTRHTVSNFTETVTSKEREARYNKVKTESEKSRKKLSLLKQELSQLKQDIATKSEGAEKHRERLNDIAMKRENLTDFSYIGEMMLTESTDKGDSYEERIKELQLKRIARMLAGSYNSEALSAEEWWSKYCPKDVQT